MQTSVTSLVSLWAVIAFQSVGGTELELMPRQDAAVDGDGTAWGLSGYSHGNYENHLIVYDGIAWRAVDFTQPEGAFSPVTLRAGPGGSVLCFWNAADDTCIVTRHRAGKGGVVGRLNFRMAYDGQELISFVDSRGDAWLTGCTPEIVRIRATGEAEVVHRIDAAKMRQMIRNNGTTHNPVYSQEDSAGHLWFTSLEQATGPWTLRGFLRFDGTDFHHVEIPSLADKIRVHFFAPAAPGRLWLAVSRPTSDARDIGGLQEFDVEGSIIRKIEEPEANAFVDVMTITPLADAMYVVARANPYGCNLWRYRHGLWTKLLTNYNRRGYTTHNWLRFLQPVSGGLVVAGAGEMPWFVAGDGSSGMALDWQAGLPMRVVRRFLPLPDGRFLAVGGERAFLGTLEFPPKQQPTDRVQEITEHAGWSIDKHGHVWTSLGPERRFLHEWNGSEWRPHEIPPDVRATSFEQAHVDTRGRVWLLPNEHGREVAFYDSEAAIWQTFGSIEKAFEAHADDLPVFTGTRPQSYAPDGVPTARKITFRTRDDQISSFDGVTWRRWRLTDIRPGRQFWFRGAPFFSTTGRLRVCLGSEGVSESTWELNEDERWEPCEDENRFPDENASGPHPEGPKVEMPEGCVTKTPDSAVADQFGVIWLTWRDAIYRAVPGACEPVFVPRERHPFQTGRRVAGVWTDPRGNVFVDMAQEHTRSIYSRCMIRPKGPIPRTTILAEKPAQDSVRIKIHSDVPALQFRVQHNEGPWQSVTRDTLDYAFLAAGKHRFRAVSLDASLQSSISASELEIEVVADPATQIAEMISALNDASYARREASVAALVQKGEAALPGLSKARKGAVSDIRWWIDVALQEIQREQQAPDFTELQRHAM